MAMTPLVRSLRGRFGGLKALANELRMSRSHLSEVLMNRKGRGGIVRKKVAAIMTPEELHMAGWNADGTLMEKRPPVSSAEIKRRIRRVI